MENVINEINGWVILAFWFVVLMFVIGFLSDAPGKVRDRNLGWREKADNQRARDTGTQEPHRRAPWYKRG